MLMLFRFKASCIVMIYHLPLVHIITVSRYNVNNDSRIILPLLAVDKIHRCIQIVLNRSVFLRLCWRCLQQSREAVQRIGLNTQLHRFQHALKKSVFLLPRFQIGIIGKLLFPVKIAFRFGILCLCWT